MKKHLFLTLAFAVVAFAPLLAQNVSATMDDYYSQETRWTELRLDTTKYDAWYTMSEDGKARCMPNYERTDYYVQGDTIHRGNRYSMV